LLTVLLIYTTSIYYIDSFNFTNKSSDSQTDELPLKTANEFEYFEKFGTLNDTNSIQIELPDLTWNITEIQLNFTNINQHRQLRIIEDNISESLLKPLYKSNPMNYIDMYGQEINFSEPTEVFGIYLYGFKTSPSEESVWVRFRGFDDSTQTPNSTTYESRKLNIADEMINIGWYYQNFTSSSPLIFNKDEFYIVIDGSSMSWSTTYYFACNPKNPTYPLLWEWERNDDGVSKDQGETFLCKILQKVNKTYFPKELKMQAFIDESYHDIINGAQSGEGNLSLTPLNFKPASIYFDIPILINDSSLTVRYNVSYQINLRKPVSVMIIEVGGGNGDNSKVSTGIATELFFILLFLIIISVLGALTSYRTVRKLKIKKRGYREKIFNKYMDVLNLNYIMISDKRSGLNIYEQMISGRVMNPTLLSGFLQAIRSFGLELTGSEEQSQTIKLEFQKSKIVMSEFRNYRLINIFEENPSKEFMDSIEPLSQDIDKQYGKLLKNFDGEVTKFEGIKALLEKHLRISLVYPLKVFISDDIKLKSEEKTLVSQVLNFMKKENSDHFYISYLMSEGVFNPKRAEKILGLIERKIFQPVL
jgi:hypothetical protein